MNDYTKKEMKDGVELSYTDDGKIEILISDGFGAGWSTWDLNNGISIAVDKRIIDFFKAHGCNYPINKVTEFMESIGYGRMYCGGWKKLRVTTVEKGMPFMISEYDGAESLYRVGREDFYEF
jgi:hypothetical protein